MKELNLLSMRILSDKESIKMSTRIFKYITELNKGVNKIKEKNNISEKENIKYSAKKIPMDNSNCFKYDKSKFNIDSEIDELLENIKNIMT